MFISTIIHSIPMISPTEALILSLLVTRPGGAFGSELVQVSDGKLKRGSVSALMGRLEKSGLVTSVEEAATDVYALPRTRYKISAAGYKARVEFGRWTGFLPSGVTC
jgi:DNA-binding PadR family transcriptional regulator